MWICVQARVPTSVRVHGLSAAVKILECKMSFQIIGVNLVKDLSAPYSSSVATANITHLNL